MKHMRIAFFGTPDIAVYVLDELQTIGIMPDLIVTNPDKPQGRKMILTPPPAKVWAAAHTVEVFQPENLKEKDKLTPLTEHSFDLFIVVAYGKIMPTWLIELPKHKTLNVHPSLLPKFRGASPIRSAILADEKNTGVTIMLMDEEMDHGPIVAQKEIPIDNWPIPGRVLDKLLATEGGKLLASIIPDWIAGKIETEEQGHSQATFCKKITKADGEINLDDDPYQNYLKIQAYDGWPGTFFFTEKNDIKIRVKITDADYNNGKLILKKVVPEGKKELKYSEFQANS